MSAIISLVQGSQLPAYMQNRAALVSVNADVLAGGLGFPVLSIKGKVFTLVKDGERKVLTRADDPEEAVQFLNLSVVRANTKSRVFYAKAYVEGSEGDAAKPDCYSNDGVAPGADARAPQAKKCQLCPHAVWESKKNPDGSAAKGTACTVNTRLSVIDPDHIVGVEKPEPYLLRVPAGSRANFADVVKTAEARGIPYNALAIKVGFDKEAPSPKLTFKIVGLLSDPAFEVASTLYEDDVVKEMVGLGPVRAALPAPAETTSTATEEDLDAALAARSAQAAVEKAKAAPVAAPAATEEDLDSVLPPVKPAAKPKAAPKPAPVDVEDAVVVAEAPAAAPAKPAKAAPKPVDVGDAEDLLGGLDALLSATDD